MSAHIVSSCPLDYQSYSFLFGGRIHIPDLVRIILWKWNVRIFCRIHPNFFMAFYFSFNCKNIFLGFTLLLFYPWLSTFLSQNIEWVEIPMDRTILKFPKPFFPFYGTGKCFMYGHWGFSTNGVWPGFALRYFIQLKSFDLSRIF